MVNRTLLVTGLFCLVLTGCAPVPAPPEPDPVTETASPPTASPVPSPTFTLSPSPSLPPTSTETATPLPSETSTPVIESLKARVTADLLSCRYGPGPEYLYLYGLRKEANIKLIGRTDGGNWTWVYVDGKNKCWVNAKFLTIEGDWQSLPIVYPDLVRIPRSPYYDPPTGVYATRDGNRVEVSWNPIRLRAGDEEDEFMLLYIAEIWRCEGGRLLFEPMATNDLSVTFVDEPGCDRPSRGRVFFQEKHGFAGPSEVNWPAHETAQ